MLEVLRHDIPRLLNDIQAGRLTVRDLTLASLDAAEAVTARTHAFLAIEHDAALEQAALADEAIAAGRSLGPLHGIPYALKDVIDVEGRPTTAHSAATDGEPAPVSASVHELLQAAGAVYVGKLATHEFALGGPSHDLPYPPALNPWNTSHVPGASSSGAGAAVAVRAVKLAIGTDTSGSVRNPAAHCGVYGLKPTFGVVPRRGVFPLSFSLDHMGPLVASARDLAPVLAALARYDPRDPSSVPGAERAAATEPTTPPRRDRAGGAECSTSSTGPARIGFARDFYHTDPALDPHIGRALDRFATTLSDLGHEVTAVDLPPFELFNAAGRILMAAESFAIHEPRITTQPDRYGRYTYQRVMPGAAVPASDLVAADQLRRRLTAALDDTVFTEVDVVLTANALAPAARFDDFLPDWPPLPRASATRTIAFNLTGHPALAVPIELDPEGMPVSAQLVGRRFADGWLCALAAELESAGAISLPPAPLSLH